MHGAAGEQMKMDMKHALPRLVVGVHHQPVTMLGEALLCGELFGGEKQLADQHGIIALQIIDRGDMFARNDQDVGRRLGVEITKGDDIPIFIDLGGWDLAINNLAKDTVHDAPERVMAE